MDADQVARFGDWFRNRADTYCVQQPDGSYRRLYQVVDDDCLAAHLAGDQTLALDAVGADGLTRWGMLDSDTPDGLGVLAEVWTVCTRWNLSPLLEASRRGGHLWLLWSTPQPAAAVRRVLHAALAAVGATMEAYPNVDRPLGGKGIAQPVRLPLGVHQVTGQRYGFIDLLGRPLHRPVAGLPWLLAQRRHTSAQLGGVLAQLGAVAAPVLGAVAPVGMLAISDDAAGVVAPGARYGGIQWARSRSLYWLIAQTRPAVTLRRTRKGWLGWCPWHDDNAPQADGSPGTPSLYVYCDPVHGWRWFCYSPNCGAYHRPGGKVGHRVQDGFDWLLWSSAGSWRGALDLADQLSGKEGTDG